MVRRLTLTSADASLVDVSSSVVLFSLLVSASVFFIVFIPTLFFGIPGGDSGELVAEACQLGVAHPPGYPLFVYFARAAIEFLPSSIGSPAWRVNAACAALSAAGCGFIFSTTVRLTRRVAPRIPEYTRLALSAASAVAWAISPLIWLYSIGAEVFALSNFFVALLMWAFIVFSDAAMADDADPAKLLTYSRWIAFLCGLALTNQHTNVLLALPIAVWIGLALSGIIFLPPRGLHVIKKQTYFLRVGNAIPHIAGLIGAFILGLVPYLHLPIAHTFWRGPGSWGDASTLRGWIAHFLRSDYGTFRLYAREGHSEAALERTLAWAHDLIEIQLPVYWSGPVVVGALLCLWTLRHFASCVFQPRRHVASKRNDDDDDKTNNNEIRHAMNIAAAVGRTAPGAIVFFILFYFTIFHSLSNMPLKDPLLNAVHARFWMQPNTLIFPLAAVGVAGTFDLFLFIISAVRSDDDIMRQVSPPLSLALIAIATSSILTAHIRARPLVDHSRNDVMDRYGRALLEPLPPNAMLITSFDMQWTAARYLQTCEHVRSDIVLLNAPVASYSWFSAQTKLYEALGAVFSGSHLVPHLTAPHAAGGFSFLDLIVANTQNDCGVDFFSSYTNDPPHELFVGLKRQINCTELPRGGVFFTGSLVSGAGRGATKEEAFLKSFDVLPFGIVSTVRRRERKLASVTSWRNFSSTPSSTMLPTDFEVHRARTAWKAATDRYDGLIDVKFYDAGTWERATRIDFWAQAVTHATWLLEWALSDEAQSLRSSKNTVPTTATSAEGRMDVETALEAAAILEQAVWSMAEHGETTMPAATMKNLGLVYVRLVRSKEDDMMGEGFGLPLLPLLRIELNTTTTPAIHDIVHAPTWGIIKRDYITVSHWRTAASERVLVLWTNYLKTAEAKLDPGLSSIEGVVKVLRAAKGASTASAATATEGGVKKVKQKRGKRE